MFGLRTAAYWGHRIRFKSVSISRKAFGDAYMLIETYNTNSMLFLLYNCLLLGSSGWHKSKKAMAINLQKGQRIEIGLQKVGVGLGWDPNEGTGFDFDLDASAFMLGEN